MRPYGVIKIRMEVTQCPTFYGQNVAKEGKKSCKKNKKGRGRNKREGKGNKNIRNIGEGGGATGE